MKVRKCEQMFSYQCQLLKHQGIDPSKLTARPLLSGKSRLVIVRMTTLQIYSKEKVHPAVRFLSAEGLNPSDIRREILAMLDDERKRKIQVYKKVRKFRIGLTSLHDADCPEEA